MVSAYASGRFTEMRQPSVLKARPYWQWRAVGDDRTRPEHAAADGTVLPADHPFWKTAYPPAGYMCRCRVVSRSAKWVERNGGVTAPPRGLPDPGFDAGTQQLVSADAGQDVAKPPEPPETVKPGSRVPKQVRKLSPVKSDPSEVAEQLELLDSLPSELGREEAQQLIDLLGAKVPVELAQKHPRLVAGLNGRLTVLDEHWQDPRVRQQVANLALVDPRILHSTIFAQKQDCFGVFIGTGNLTKLNYLSHLKGVRPRGWPSGRTWDDVGGAGGPKEAVVSVDGISGSISTVLHEWGHMLGSRGGWDDSTELIAHHKRLYAKQPEYMQQDGPGGRAGREEMFAESVADFFRMPKDLFASSQYDQEYLEWMARILSPR